MEVRQIVGARQAVVHSVAVSSWPVLAVDRALHQRLADALRDAAMHLACEQQRVQGEAEIVDDRVAHDVRRRRCRDRSRPRRHACRSDRSPAAARRIRSPSCRSAGRRRQRRDVGVGDRPVGARRSGSGRRRFRDRRPRLRACRRPAPSAMPRASARRASTMTAPTGIEREPPVPLPAGDPVGVALHDLDPLERHVEILRHDLRIGGLMALTVRLRADQHGEVAVLLELDRARPRRRPRPCIRCSSRCRGRECLPRFLRLLGAARRSPA